MWVHVGSALLAWPQERTFVAYSRISVGIRGKCPHSPQLMPSGFATYLVDLRQGSMHSVMARLDYSAFGTHGVDDMLCLLSHGAHVG